MATPITSLPVVTSLTDASDYVPVVASGVTSKITASSLAADSAFTSRYLDAINVKSYGAVGDGVTDDTAEIQAAIAAADAAGNENVYFPPGTYLVSSAVSLASNVNLRGAGLDASTIQLNVSDIGLSGSSVTDLTISDLSVTGASARAISFASSSRITVERCKITGATTNNGSTYSGGIYLNGVTDVKILDNILSGNGIGASANRSADIMAYTTANSRVLIRGNRCTSTAAHFNIMGFNCSDTKVERNFCSGAISDASNNSGYGIALYQTLAPERNVVEGNTVTDTQGCGIYLEVQLHSIVRGNHVIDCVTSQSDVTLPAAGISLNGCPDVICTDNIVRGSGKAGISTGGTGANAPARGLIAKNNVEGSTGAGIRLRGDDNFTRVIGNIVNGGSRGIYVQLSPDGVVIESNTVMSTSTTSIGIDLAASPTNFKVDNNVVSEAGGYGINVSTGVRGRIAGNTVVNCGAGNAGVYDGMQVQSTDTLIAGNHVYNDGTNNQNYGIRLGGASAGVGVAIRDNNLTGNKTGSIIGGLSAAEIDGRVLDATTLLAEAPLWLDAARSVAAETAMVNYGSRGTTLNATYGSTTGSDTNDPKLLTGSVPYLYFPGASGNTATQPDPAWLAGATELDVRVAAAPDDWTPSGTLYLVTQGAGTTNANGSFAFWLESTGNLRFGLTDGATFSNATASSAAAASTAGVSDGALLLVRATWRASDQRVQYFYKTTTEAAYATDIAANAGWTQLGIDRSTSGIATLVDYSGTLNYGGLTPASAVGPYTGKMYAAWVATTIDGTVAAFMDASVLTTGAATSFTEQSSNAATVTINRGTTGRKTVAYVGRPLLLFGTDDYLEVVDDPTLDMAATTSFTVMAIRRRWATLGNSTLVSKRSTASTSAGTVGWTLGGDATNNTFTIDDGTNATSDTQATASSGTRSALFAVRNTNADTITTYNGATGTATTDTTTATLANSDVLRVGRLAGAGTTYADMELEAVAVWRRALTDVERTVVAAHYDLVA